VALQYYNGHQYSTSTGMRQTLSRNLYVSVEVIRPLIKPQLGCSAVGP
jgi:hypothetical protein